ncbi:MAG: hypothetical protein AAB091_02970 [Elusimicrobiota bacterium]
MKSNKEKKAIAAGEARAAAPGAQPGPRSSAQGAAAPLLSSGQIRGVMAGILLVIAGFIVLSRADPAARNWAGTICPFLILGGYAVIGVALWRGKT